MQPVEVCKFESVEAEEFHSRTDYLFGRSTKTKLRYRFNQFPVANAGIKLLLFSSICFTSQGIPEIWFFKAGCFPEEFGIGECLRNWWTDRLSHLYLFFILHRIKHLMSKSHYSWQRIQCVSSAVCYRCICFTSASITLVRQVSPYFVVVLISKGSVAVGLCKGLSYHPLKAATVRKGQHVSQHCDGKTNIMNNPRNLFIRLWWASEWVTFRSTCLVVIIQWFSSMPFRLRARQESERECLCTTCGTFI